MPDLARLHDEHRQLQTIGRRLSRILTQDIPPAPTVLFAIRQEYASALIRHLMTEDWVLYPRLLASSDKTVSRTAREFSEEMGGLAKSFKEHSERWGSFAIESDWKGYRRETRIILDAMALRVTRENDELYPLFERLAQREAKTVNSCNEPGRAAARLR